MEELRRVITFHANYTLVLAHNSVFTHVHCIAYFFAFTNVTYILVRYRTFSNPRSHNIWIHISSIHMEFKYL